MSQFSEQLTTLQQQLVRLSAQASQLDKQLPDWQQTDRIHSEHFQTRSRYLLDYVQEAMSLQQRLLQSDNAQSQQLLAVKLQQQLQVLMRSFQSDAVQKRQTAPRKPYKKPPETSQHRAGALLQQLGGNGQALYQQLAEYHGFERRLQQMVQEAASANDSVEKQLTLQARLGRCRKAIGSLEAEILWYEQKGLKR